MDATSLFADVSLVPMIVVEHASQAVPLAEALLDSGVGCLEIALRSDAALGAIERVVRAFPEALVGAGSVRRPEQFPQSRDAGARFAVSPGFSERLLAAAQDTRLPFIPGAVTATEIITLFEHGYRLQKFFPAEASGGLARLRALAAPLPEVRFLATGGLTAALAREYLACEAVACVGGSWFAPIEAVRAGDLARIRNLTAAAVQDAAWLSHRSRRG